AAALAGGGPAMAASLGRQSRGDALAKHGGGARSARAAARVETGGDGGPGLLREFVARAAVAAERAREDELDLDLGLGEHAQKMGDELVVADERRDRRPSRARRIM